MRLADHPRHRASASVAVTLAALLLAGCAAPQPLPVPTSSPNPSLGPVGDGVLRIGTLTPLRGDVSALGPAMIAAVETAVRDVNAAGGVLGMPVETVHRPSGRESDDTLESSFAELVERDVDVIIGPASATLAERLGPLAAEAGILVIAPAALAPVDEGVGGDSADATAGDDAAAEDARAVDAAGDDGQANSAAPPLMVGLIPDPSLQAVAIVDDVVASGATSLAVLGSADAASRGVVDAVRVAATAAGVRVTAVEQLDAQSTPNRVAFSLAAAEPEAIVIATAGTLTETLRDVLVALTERGVAGHSLRFAASSSVDHEGELPQGALDGAMGLREGAVVSDDFAARVRQSDPFVRGARLAPESYDAVVLAALAATLADADGGTRVAARLADAAAEGIPCRSFGECLSVLDDGRDIDYDGLSGPLTMDARGRLVTGSWSLLRYDEAGAPTTEGVVTAAQP